MPGIETKKNWTEIKVRILEPSLFIDGSFRTKSFGDGISAIVGKLKTKPDAMTIQAYRFKKDKGWTVETVRTWLKEHEINFTEIDATKTAEMYKRIYSTEAKKVVIDFESKSYQVLVVNWKDVVSHSNSDSEQITYTLFSRVSTGLLGGIYTDNDGIEFMRLIQLKDFEISYQEDYIDIPTSLIIVKKEVGNVEFDFDSQILLENNYMASSEINLIEVDYEEKLATIELIRVGQWEHLSAPNGLLQVDEDLIDEFINNFDSGILGKEIPLDYKHIDDSTTTPGWIIKMEKEKNDDTGVIRIIATLHITDVADLPNVKSTWTRILEKSLKYISPSIALGWKNPADGESYNVIKSAALTNYPHIKGMDEIKPINFESLNLENGGNEGMLTIEDIKKIVEAKNIKMADAVKSIIELNSSTDISDEDKLKYTKEIIWSSEDFVWEVTRQVETAKAVMMEEQAKASATINNTEAETIKNENTDLKSQVEVLTGKVADLEAKIPAAASIVISAEEYKQLILKTSGVETKVQEMLSSRIIGSTKDEIDASMNENVQYVASIQEMIGGKSNATASGSPAKTMSGIDASNYVMPAIAEKMKK